MSHRGPLTAVITTVLGVTLGGLLVWRVYRTKRRRLLSVQKVADPVEALCPAEKEVKAVETLDTPPPPPQHPPEEELKAVESQTTQPTDPFRIPSPEQLLTVNPVTVSSEEEWLQTWPLMQKELAVFPVLGIDCEWVKADGVSVKGRSSSVSLLQMATYSGLCVLVRLLAFRSGQQSFPLSLMEVLRDPHVLKVGVGCYEDGKRLTRDYGLSLSCTVDLRYLALRQRQVAVSNGLSLKSLAEDLLNVSLDKSLELRCSDWEAERLTLQQITYAARDAQVSIALFLHLLGLDSAPGPQCSSESSYSELASRCQGLLDVSFRGRGDSEDKEGEKRRRTRTTPTFESPESGDQQVPDPRKNNKRKPLGVGYSARKSPLYDNCFLHAPDGQPLCTCDKKKAKWYLDKGIGVLQSEEPFVVRLLFEPSGRPDSQQDYYLTARENLCVVCGKADSYIRKNIVPHEYRRHFPTEMKDHNSHDILLLCTCCHAASNVHDGFLKQRLANEFSAPQGCEEGVRQLEDSDRRRVRSAARALLTAGDALPEPRRHELQDVIRGFLQSNEEQQLTEEQLTEEQLQQAAELEIRIFNEAYVPHGLKVVRALADRGLQGLMELERRWRQHFLKAMQPRHLPPLWAVDHNHRKFLRKYGEDLPIKLN
ncbi:exonuclease 3'-5' domain-containing protein 2 isoform X1 [Pseudochaenichthys georgianus]|uniref:exonuclease 3'-5' domain-containing protein 2 isoform X1 n=1 Tax=Pseudochaenichthys georgianus TaxID=52239 RepID=UPI00146A9C80|nr:exonuclease 3'-5' domain-containing protein 2 isoform X1 [Pseudochaenichthys georgianus]